MDTIVIESPVGDNCAKREKRRQRERKRQARNAAQIRLQTDETLEAPILENGDSEKISLDKDLTTQPPVGNPMKDPGTGETPSEGNAMEPRVIQSLAGDNSRKGRLKRKRKRLASLIINETHETLDDSNSKVANGNSENILLEKDLTAQPLVGNPKMDPSSAETPSTGHAIDPMVIERPVVNNSEIVEIKRQKKERKKQAKKAEHITIQMQTTLEDSKVANGNLENIILEELTEQPLGGNRKMDLSSAENPSEGHATDPVVIERPVVDNSEKLEKRRQKKERKEAKKAAHIIIQTHETSEDSKVANVSLETVMFEKDLTGQPLGGNPKMDLSSAETPLDGHEMDPLVIERPVGDNSENLEKMRQKKDRKKEAKTAAHIIIQTHETLEDSKVANVNLEKILLEKDLAPHPLGGNLLGSAETPSERHAKKKNKKMTNEEEANDNLEKILLEKDLTAQTLSGNPKTDLGSEESPSEGHANKISKKKMKGTHEDEGQGKIDVDPTKILVEGNVTGKKERKRKMAAIEDESRNMCQTGSTEIVVEEIVTHKRKMKRNKTMKEETKDVTTNVSSSDVKDAECLCPVNAQITSTRRRKLLVLDLNGVLADIVRPPVSEEIRRGTRSIFGQTIVKRPFYDDFLNFCFENFDVAIWSSRSSHRVTKIVDYLLGDLQRKLVFCWDMTHVTPTGFQTIENSKKPVVFKELRKIWDNNNPRLGWKKGDYDESNTLLLDDSPYKALLNPVHTAIFPISYCCWNKDDNSLAPGGDLRVYLEGLLASENVQDYVKQNPFGQSAITKQNPSWSFYERVVNCVSGPLQNQNRFSRVCETTFFQ